MGLRQQTVVQTLREMRAVTQAIRLIDDKFRSIVKVCFEHLQVFNPLISELILAYRPCFADSANFSS